MAVRQTACRFCGLDIENFSPYRKGEWRDRGGNRRCNDKKRHHAPIRGKGVPVRAGGGSSSTSCENCGGTFDGDSEDAAKFHDDADCL